MKSQGVRVISFARGGRSAAFLEAPIIPELAQRP